LNLTIKSYKTIEVALKNHHITTEEALALIDDVEFMERSQDILQWGRYYFPHKIQSNYNDLHRHIKTIMFDEMTCTMASRGHAKTTMMCFLVPIYLALNFPEKYQHFLNVQSTTSKAISVNISIKEELETNEKLIADYGNQIGKKWTEKQFVLKNGVIFSAIGAGESMRGTNYKNIRPDFIICDDLLDDDDRYNVERVYKKNHWIWASLYPARNILKKCCFHFVGTPIHRQDILSVLSERADVIFAKFAAVKNWDKKETLWMSWDELMKIKRNVGSLIFSQEYMCELIDDDTAKIKESWIKYHDKRPDDSQIIDIRFGVDPAIGENKNNDYTAKIVVYRCSNNRYWIEEARNEHISMMNNLDEIEFMSNRLSTQPIIETISGFQAFSRNLHDRGVSHKLITHKKNKLAELDSIAPLFEQGLVSISKSIPSKIRSKLVEQLILNHPPNDDLRDALIICLSEEGKNLIFDTLNREKHIIKPFNIASTMFVEVAIKVDQDQSWLLYRAMDRDNNWYIFLAEQISGNGEEVASKIIEKKYKHGLNIVRAITEERKKIVGMLYENNFINELHSTLYYNDIEFVQLKSDIQDGVVELRNKLQLSHAHTASFFLFNNLPTVIKHISNVRYTEKNKFPEDRNQYAYCAAMLGILNTRYDDIMSLVKNLDEEE